MIAALYDFSSAEELKSWRIINDGVMGGLSQSEISHRDQSAIYKGTISLENNGGFASTRTMPKNLRLEGYKGISLRIKGDGKKYQFRIRANSRFDGVSYRNIFETKKDEWMTINLAFSDFIPTWRGRILKEVKALDPSEIQQIGFLIANREAEDFKSKSTPLKPINSLGTPSSRWDKSQADFKTALPAISPSCSRSAMISSDMLDHRWKGE